MAYPSLPTSPHCHHLTVSSYANTNTLREKKRKEKRKYKEKSQKGKRKRRKESIKRKDEGNKKWGGQKSESKLYPTFF